MLQRLLRLIEPSPLITKKEERQKSMLLSAMLLMFSISMVFLAFILHHIASLPHLPPVVAKLPMREFGNIVLIFVLGYVSLYVLSKTQYYKIAGFFFLILVCIAVFGTSLTTDNLFLISNDINYMVVAILIASMIFSGPLTAFFGGVAIVLTLLVPLASPYSIEPVYMLPIASFLATIGFLAALSSTIQRSFVQRAEAAEEQVAKQHRLAEKSLSHIRSMFKGMKLGIMSVGPEMKILPYYSPYLETLTQTRDIAGKEFFDFILEKSDLNAEKKKMCMAAISSAFGEDVINFELNEHIMPKSFKFKPHSDQPEIILEVNFNPIIIDHKVDEMLIILRDITQIERLKEENRKQSDELDKLLRILKVPKDDFLDFIEHSEEFIKSSQRLIASFSHAGSDSIAIVFRHLHTIKGNARVLGLSDVSAVAHIAEEFYDKLRFQSEIDLPMQEIAVHLQPVRDILKDYRNIFREKIAGYLSQNTKKEGGGLSLLIAARDAFVLEEINQASELAPRYATIRRYFEEMCSDSIGSCLKTVLEDTPILAAKLGKPAPKIVFEGSEVLIPNDFDAVIKDVFSHLIRNSLDHGIEIPEERIEQGKNPEGIIFITCKETQDSIEIYQSDDGQGLDFEKIKEVAKARGLIRSESLPKKSILEIIFVSSFTTKKEITSISGRGVGLDVVRGYIEEKGGKVELLVHESSHAAFVGFKIKISVPKIKRLMSVEKTFLQSLKAVIVEDDEDQAQALKMSFEEVGMAVRTFGRAEEAYDFLQVGLCDVLVTDYRLPMMLGDELIAKLKAEARLPNIVVVLSGFVRDSGVKFSGASVIFDKPISHVTILNFVKDHVRMLSA